MKTLQGTQEQEEKKVHVIARYDHIVDQKTKRIQPEIVWTVHSSSSGYDYCVTLLDGKVTGCHRMDGEDCPSWHWRQRCHHAICAWEAECERKQQEAAIQAAKAIKARWAEIDAVVSEEKSSLHNSEPLHMVGGIPMR